MPGSTDIARLLQHHNAAEQAGGPGTFASWIGVNCEIHPGDEIFRFIHDHPDSLNPLRDYLVDGWRTSYELMVLLEKVGSPLADCESFLEFACGYGRLSRHLAKFPGADRVHVSDLMPGAIEFIHDKFGLPGFASHHDPRAVRFPRRFAVVFVLSLFSHLPRDSWRDWLDTLFGAVETGGILVFTTHGDGFAQRNDVALDAEGFFFTASSESDHLDGARYGTTITSEAFVRRAVDALDNAELLLMQPDHFWVGQDAWLVRKLA